MVRTDEFLQIPTPFRDVAGRREHSDEPEGINLFEGQPGEGRFRGFPSGCCADRLYNSATAEGGAFDTGGDGVPVDQSEGSTGVVKRDPSSTTWLGGTKHFAAIHNPRRGRQPADPRQFFVPVHGEAK